MKTIILLKPGKQSAKNGEFKNTIRTTDLLRGRALFFESLLRAEGDFRGMLF